MAEHYIAFYYIRSSYNCFWKESRFLQGESQLLQDRHSPATPLHTLLKICLISGKVGLDSVLCFHLSTQLDLHWSCNISLCMINRSSLCSPSDMSFLRIAGPTLSSFKTFSEKLQAPLGLWRNIKDKSGFSYCFARLSLFT